MAPAIVPAAPPWFSTTTGTPSRLLRPSARIPRDAVARTSGRKRDDEADGPLRKRRMRAPGHDGDGAEHGDEQRPHGQIAGARHFRISKGELVWWRLRAASIVFQFEAFCYFHFDAERGSFERIWARELRNARAAIRRPPHCDRWFRRRRCVSSRAGLAVRHGARARALPPGGPIDLPSRLLVDRLAAQTKGVFILEHRAGAGGTIGRRRSCRRRPTAACSCSPPRRSRRRPRSIRSSASIRCRAHPDQPDHGDSDRTCRCAPIRRCATSPT